MPPLTAEDKLEYVLSVLRHTADFSPDFHKVAADNNIGNGNKAQIKFKKIIDDSGKFKLIAGKVVAVDGNDTSSTPTKPTAGRPKKAAAKKGEKDKPAQKKRKIQEVEAEAELDDDDAQDEEA